MTLCAAGAHRQSKLERLKAKIMVYILWPVTCLIGNDELTHFGPLIVPPRGSGATEKLQRLQDLIPLNHLVRLSEVVSSCVCPLCGMIIGDSS